MLRLGVSLQPGWPIDDETAVLRAASHAEDLDFDHVAVGNRLLDSGFGLDADPLVLLSAVSAVTTRLRLLTSVLVAPYYPALVLANQAATLDVISGGRLILGAGTGWNPEEYDAVGIPARERGARTDDHLAAAKALWAQRPTDFDGPFTTLRHARFGGVSHAAGHRRGCAATRDGHSVAPRLPLLAWSTTSGGSPRRGSPPARRGCLSRPSTWRRRWTGSQPRLFRTSPEVSTAAIVRSAPKCFRVTICRCVPMPLTLPSRIELRG